MQLERFHGNTNRSERTRHRRKRARAHPHYGPLIDTPSSSFSARARLARTSDSEPEPPPVAQHAPWRHRCLTRWPDVPSAPPYLPGTAHPCSFKYETFYGWHPSDGNFTNVGQSPVPKGLAEFYNETGKPGILELEGVFFTAAPKPLRGMVMKPGGAAAWKALAAEIQPLVESKGEHEHAASMCSEHEQPACALEPLCQSRSDALVTASSRVAACCLQ